MAKKLTELDKNLGEVVRMARPGKEAFVAYSTTFFVVLLELILLNVADGLHDNTNCETNYSQNIGSFVEGRLGISVDNGAVQHSHRHTDCPDLDIKLISNVLEARGHSN